MMLYDATLLRFRCHIRLISRRYQPHAGHYTSGRHAVYITPSRHATIHYYHTVTSRLSHVGAHVRFSVCVFPPPREPPRHAAVTQNRPSLLPQTRAYAIAIVAIMIRHCYYGVTLRHYYATLLIRHCQ